MGNSEGQRSFSQQGSLPKEEDAEAVGVTCQASSAQVQCDVTRSAEKSNFSISCPASVQKYLRPEPNRCSDVLMLSVSVCELFPFENCKIQ